MKQLYEMGEDGMLKVDYGSVLYHLQSQCEDLSLKVLLTTIGCTDLLAYNLFFKVFNKILI